MNEFSALSNKELEEKIDEIEALENAIFMEQMKDYIDWPWYYEARDKLNTLKDELLVNLAKTGKILIIDGKKYKVVINEKE